MNILLSKLNFNEPWAYPYLSEFLCSCQHITVLPFSFWDSEVHSVKSWKAVYGNGGKYFNEITNCFSAYGIYPSQFTFINYFSDNEAIFSQALQRSDVLFLPGGAPDLTMQRIHERRFSSTINSYPGIIIGCSAGAMVQCSCFHITPNRFYPTFFHKEGLGLLPACYGVEVHFFPDEHHINSLVRTVQETGRKILLLDNESGAIFQDDQWHLMGNATFYPY